MDGHNGACYICQMNQAAKDILQRAEHWPPEDQDELVEFALEIEARRTGVYRLNESERLALIESTADVRIGRFATDDEIAEIFKKARAARG
jgi:hypothetical protein